MVAMGMGQLLAGTRFLPGANHTDPVVDSQIRALGALAVWAGVVQVWATRHQSVQLLRVLGAVSASLLSYSTALTRQHHQVPKQPDDQ